MSYTSCVKKNAITIHADLLVEIQILDGVAEGLNVQLSDQLPLEILGVQHVARELGEGGFIGDDKLALYLQVTAATTIDRSRKTKGRLIVCSCLCRRARKLEMRGAEGRLRWAVVCGNVKRCYTVYKVDLRGSACARDLSSTELLVIPEDSDKTREGNLGVEGTSLLHHSLHDNVHATRRGVGDVLGSEMRG